MNKKIGKTEKKNNSVNKTKRKMVYEPPAIISREPLESIAGYCAKSDVGICGNMGIINS